MKKLIAALLIAFLCISLVHADSSPAGYSITINAASQTLKLYKGELVIKEFPIAVGKPATKSPLGSFKIINKAVNPWWNNHGNPVAPGPKNPLGIRWMGISATTGTYGIHGNSVPSSIGTYASGGCIRMFNSDVERLFSIVPIGTPVQIIYDNIELKQDKYTNTPVLMVYPDTYRQKNAEALLKRIRANNSAISDKQAAEALKLAKGSNSGTAAVSVGIPFLFNNQFITNDAFIEKGETYIYYLAAIDYFGLDSEALTSLNIKTTDKSSRLYINMTDAAAKIGGKIRYDKNNNNIFYAASIVKINGRYLADYNGGFDKEYNFERTMLQAVSGDVIPTSGNRQIVNLKDYANEKSWNLNADSLYKIMNIEIPLKVKVGEQYLNTVFWNNRYYLKYQDSAIIPGIENQVLNLYDYNNTKYIDLIELMEVYECKKDSFFTEVELIRPLNDSIGDSGQPDTNIEAEAKNMVQ